MLLTILLIKVVKEYLRGKLIVRINFRLLVDIVLKNPNKIIIIFKFWKNQNWIPPLVGKSQIILNKKII